MNPLAIDAEQDRIPANEASAKTGRRKNLPGGIIAAVGMWAAVGSVIFGYSQAPPVKTASTSPTLGTLTDLEGAYSYYRRGTTTSCFPDLKPDRGGTEGSIPFAKGSLFTGENPVGWRSAQLYDIGVDILIEFPETCFVDRVVITQDPKSSSGLGAAEGLAASDGNEFRAVGRLDAGIRGVISDETVDLPLGVAARSLVVRLHAAFRNIVIRKMDVVGHTLATPVVYPLPARISFGAPSHALPLANIKAIVLGDNASADSEFAARLLAEKIAEDFDVVVPVRKAAEARSLAGAIVIGTKGELAVLDRKTPDAILPEGYSLLADGESAWIAAPDRRGLIYGVETALSLLGIPAAAPALPECSITDRPAMQVRGVHFGLPAREDIPFIKRLIRYVLAPMRMNTVYLQITAGMQFDRWPEINEAWTRANQEAARTGESGVPHGRMVAGGGVLTKDEVRDIVAYARSYGLDVIPEVQSLSHVEYLTLTYPGIAEVEEGTAADSAGGNARGRRGGGRSYECCYCPLHPKSYEVVFDILDEIVDVVRPAHYVSMGHDEVYKIGVCPRCKDRDPAELYALEVNRLYDRLKSKGLGMMIWSDMLQPDSRSKTVQAIDRIPKDIVMLDFIWYFHTDKDIEDNLLSRGFKVIMGNMYSSHYPRFETRRRKEGMIGAQVSTWARADEAALARAGKLYDFIYSANMMWSDAYRQDLRFTYDSVITGLLPRIRSRLHGESYPSQLKNRAFVTLPLNAPGAPASRSGERLVPPGASHFRGILFQVDAPAVVQSKAARGGQHPAEVRIAVGQKFDSLVFLHTAGANAERKTSGGLVPLGAYVVELENGESVNVPVEYGGNIAVWNRRHATPLQHGMYRHFGYIATYLADPFVQAKADDGSDITVYGYEWINPRKDVTIEAVRLVADGRSDAAVMLYGLTGVRGK